MASPAPGLLRRLSLLYPQERRYKDAPSHDTARCACPRLQRLQFGHLLRRRTRCARGVILPIFAPIFQKTPSRVLVMLLLRLSRACLCGHRDLSPDSERQRRDRTRRVDKGVSLSQMRLRIVREAAPLNPGCAVRGDVFQSFQFLPDLPHTLWHEKSVVSMKPLMVKEKTVS